MLKKTLLSGLFLVFVGLFNTTPAIAGDACRKSSFPTTHHVEMSFSAIVTRDKSKAIDLQDLDLLPMDVKVLSGPGTHILGNASYVFYAPSTDAAHLSTVLAGGRMPYLCKISTDDGHIYYAARSIDKMLIYVDDVDPEENK